MDKKDLWKSVLTELQLSISAANFQTWFKGKAEITEMSESLVIIGCSTPYVKDWLEQRYLGQIKAIVDRLTEKQNSISFVVSSSLKDEPSKSIRKEAEVSSTLFEGTDF